MEKGQVPRFRPSPDVVSSRVGDSGVLVHLKTNRIFELNSTGVRIWELLGEGRDLADIEAALQREFQADAGRLAGDVRELVRQLEAAGLVSR